MSLTRVSLYQRQSEGQAGSSLSDRGACPAPEQAEPGREAIDAAMDDGFDPLTATPEECQAHVQKAERRRLAVKEMFGGGQ
jgi:hypothetical protein